MSGERFIPSQRETSMADEMERALIGFKEEVAGVKLGVEKNVKYIDELYADGPKGISIEHFRKTMLNIDFSDVRTSNFIKQIPKNEMPDLLYRAAELKESYDGVLSDEEALQRASWGEDESDSYIKSLEHTNFGEFKILKVLFNAIDAGEDPFHGIQLPENVFFGEPNIINSIDENRILYFDRLPKGLQNDLLFGIEKRYKSLFKKSIRKLLKENPRLSPESLFDNDKIFGFYLNYHNVQLLNEGKQPIDIKSLSKQDKLYLKEHFNAEVSELGYKVSNVNKNILREIRERERLIREKNARIMKEAQRINENLNKQLKSSDTNISVLERSTSGNINYDKASGQEIAESMNLSSALEDYHVSTDSYEINDKDLKEYAFNNAWKYFIEKHRNIAGIMTKDDIVNYKIFDKENKLINKNNRDKFCAKSNSVKGMAGKKLDEIFHVLQNDFTKAYNNTFDELSSNSSEAVARIGEYMKTSAIGSVIDNVRDIFSNISENFEDDLGNQGFKFKNNEPVKIQGDNLIISGEFNGANVTVCYNLKSGEVSMNSFLQFKDNSKMILGDNSLTNCKIGELESFDDILSNNGSFQSQMTLLSDIIVENSEKQSSINSIVVKFMKTFNVIGDNQEIKDIEVSEGSDLFNFLQVINNSDPYDLENFQIFMEKILEYSGLDRGKNNLLGPQENDKTEFENEYITKIRDSINDFSNNPDIFKNKVNFESSSMFGLANMIVNTITNKEAKPNRKLDSTEMVKFIQHLENDGKLFTARN